MLRSNLTKFLLGRKPKKKKAKDMLGLSALEKYCKSQDITVNKFLELAKNKRIISDAEFDKGGSVLLSLSDGISRIGLVDYKIKDFEIKKGGK